MKLQVNQCVIDAVLQMEGSTELWFDIAILNGIGITDNLAIGTKLIGLPIRKGVKEKAVVTALARRPPGSDGDTPGQFHGIDYDVIGVDMVIY